MSTLKVKTNTKKNKTSSESYSTSNCDAAYVLNQESDGESLWINIDVCFQQLILNSSKDGNLGTYIYRVNKQMLRLSSATVVRFIFSKYWRWICNYPLFAKINLDRA